MAKRVFYGASIPVQGITVPLFIIIENKSNENLMENQKKCFNFIKNENVISIRFPSNRF